MPPNHHIIVPVSSNAEVMDLTDDVSSLGDSSWRHASARQQQMRAQHKQRPSWGSAPSPTATGPHPSTCLSGASSACSNEDTWIKRDREREGRCPDCGAQTHEIRTDPTTGRERKVPLTFPNEVHRGRCLFCRPLSDAQQQGTAISRVTAPSSSASWGGAASRLSSMHNSRHVSSARSVCTVSSGGGNSIHSEPAPSPLPTRPDVVVSSYSVQQDHVTVVSNTAATETGAVDEALRRIGAESADLCDIIATMRRFSDVGSIQEKGCQALWVQSWEDDNSSAIGRVGGIPTILDAMRTHEDLSHLQRCGCEALQNLALNEYNREVITEQGGIVVIIGAMRHHWDESEVQQSGCTALANLASKSLDNKVQIAESGGILAVMKSIENFPNEESVLRAAFQALRVLGYNPGAGTHGSFPSDANQGRRLSPDATMHDGGSRYSR